jgi:uncharacterized protein YcfJ
MNMRILAAAAALVAVCACTSSGNIERNAAGGAAIGAIAGAVIGNNTGSGDAGDGAKTGAIIGGVAGAARGYGQDQRGEGQDQRLSECRNSPTQPQYFDTRAGRYYYGVPGTNRTCWDSGEPRA